MDIKKIYFDMDGVLADFVKGVHELAGCDLTDDEYMWEQVKKVDHFFSKLDPVPGSIELVKELIEKYGEKVEILTAVPKPERCMWDVGEDKTNWIRHYISDGIKVNIGLRADKVRHCQGPEYILIDDREGNIDNWQEAGGTGILFTSAENTREVMKKMENKKEIKVKFGTEDSDSAMEFGQVIDSVSLEVSDEEYNRLVVSAKNFKEMSKDESVADIYQEVCDIIDDAYADYYYNNQECLINSLAEINELNGVEEDLSNKTYSKYEIKELVSDPDRKIYFEGKVK